MEILPILLAVAVVALLVVRALKHFAKDDEPEEAVPAGPPKPRMSKTEKAVVAGATRYASLMGRDAGEYDVSARALVFDDGHRVDLGSLVDRWDRLSTGHRDRELLSLFGDEPPKGPERMAFISRVLDGLEARGITDVDYDEIALAMEIPGHGRLELGSRLREWCGMPEDQREAWLTGELAAWVAG